MKPDKRRQRGRLRLRRETLRTIAAPQLAAVAGGTLEGGIELVGADVLPGDETKPKTNAWTASDPYTVYGAQQLCTNHG